MTKKEQSDRIEHYLLNRMEDAERVQFESELNSDPELKNLTERKALLISGIKASFEAELKEKMKGEGLLLDRSNRIRRVRFISGIAAALVVGIVSYLFIHTMRHDPVRLYTEYFHSYPNINQPITRDKEQRDNPYFLYEKGEYRDALDGFNAMLEDLPGDAAALFYSGIIKMELKDFEMAIENFKMVEEEDSGRFVRPAQWYTALSYIALGNSEMAAGYLRELTGEDDLYGGSAAEILERLR